MKRVCVLLAWSIARDSRAQRTARTMARHAQVDVFHVPDDAAGGGDPFEGVANVALHAVARPERLLDRALRHTLYPLDARFLADAVLSRGAGSGAAYDVVYAHDLPTAWPAARVARRQGARLVYDVHDLAVETIDQGFPESVSPWRRLKHGFARRVMRRSSAAWERRFVRRADLVVTTTESYLAYLRERYGLRGGLVLPNVPPRCDVRPAGRLHALAGVPPGAPIVLYHGLLGRGRHLHEIVGAARHLPEGAFVVLLGDGHLLAELRALAAAGGAAGGLTARVRFVPAVPYGELLPLVADAALGLVLIEPINLSKRLALANKLTETMAAGVAVLASDVPENRRIVEATGCGTLVPVPSAAALGATLRELLADPAGLAARGAAGRRAFLERYHWEACEPAFDAAFRALLEDA